MTYEERLKHQDLVERSARLKEALGEGDEAQSMTRAEARELTELVEEILALISPERWDRLMQTVVEEATRRAGAVSPLG